MKTKPNKNIVLTSQHMAATPEGRFAMARPATSLLAALILACSLAACGGSESGSAASGSEGSLKATTAGASTTVNSVDTIVKDMSDLNDFRLKGYTNFSSGWYVGPGETHMGNNPDFNNSPTWSIFYNNPSYSGKVARAILPWLVVFDGVDHAASNVAVEMRNMRAYIKTRSSGTWNALGGPVKVGGTYYGTPDSGGLPAQEEEVIAEYSTDTGTAIKVHGNTGYFWHGWWGAGRLTVDPYDIEALFVTVQARMVVADTSQVDDRAQAQVGLQVGADYYLDSTTVYAESYAPAVGIARTKNITNEWQSFSYTTLSDVGGQQPGGGITEAVLRAAPPPME
jgi:hypothetical protein